VLTFLISVKLNGSGQTALPDSTEQLNIPSVNSPVNTWTHHVIRHCS